MQLQKVLDLNEAKRAKFTGFSSKRAWASGGAGMIFSRVAVQHVCQVLPTWDVKKATYEEYDDVMLSRMAGEANATFIRETLLRPWPPTWPTNRFRDTVTVHEMNDITWLKEAGVLIYDILGYGLP